MKLTEVCVCACVWKDNMKLTEQLSDYGLFTTVVL